MRNRVGRVLNRGCEDRWLEDSDEGEIAIPLEVIESVTDYEFVPDLECNVVRLHFLSALFFFPEQHTDLNARRSRLLPQQGADGMQSPTAVQDVIDDEYVAAIDVWKRNLIESYDAGTLRAAVVAGDAETFQLKRQRNSSQEIRGEDERTVQDCDDSQLLVAIGFRDLARDFVQSAENRLLMKKDAFNVVEHVAT